MKEEGDMEDFYIVLQSKSWSQAGIVLSLELFCGPSGAEGDGGLD